MQTAGAPYLLTYREMAKRLRVSVRTLERWVGAKRFTYGVYHGPGGGPRTVRFDAAEILEQMRTDARRRRRL